MARSVIASTCAPLPARWATSSRTSEVMKVESTSITSNRGGLLARGPSTMAESMPSRPAAPRTRARVRARSATSPTMLDT